MKKAVAKSGQASKFIVLLLSMGGPRSSRHIVDFLYHIFSDSHVLNLPFRFFLQPVCAEIFSHLVHSRWQRRYRKMGGRSNAIEDSSRLATALKYALLKQGYDVEVTFAFHYSPPFCKTAMQEAKSKNRSIILPIFLYPHYSDIYYDSLLTNLTRAKKKFFPESRLLKAPSYYTQKEFIDAWCSQIHSSLKPNESLNEFGLIFSAQAIPNRRMKTNELYCAQVEKTVQMIIEKLHFTGHWALGYQSHFGFGKPNSPNVNESIRRITGMGIHRVLVIPVSYLRDDIQTQVDIDCDLRNYAIKSGIIDFRRVPPLAGNPMFIETLSDKVKAAMDQL